jgi:site-specific recombinase XerD
MELQPMNATAATLIPTGRRESLTAWFELYMRIEGGPEGSNTFKAKKSDLEAFLTYFLRVADQDKPDAWTKSLTEGFLKHLQRDQSKSPSTVNRVLATLKHAAAI